VIEFGDLREKWCVRDDTLQTNLVFYLLLRFFGIADRTTIIIKTGRIPNPLYKPNTCCMMSGKSANTIIAKTSKIPKLRRKSFITAPFVLYVGYYNQ